MKIAIIGPGEKYAGYTTKKLLVEAGKVFKKVELIPIIDIKLQIDKKLDATYGKKSLKDFDYILPRIDSKRASIGYPVMRFLDSMDVLKPYPAETVLLAHNKFLTLETLAKKGIQVPKTFLTGSKESAKNIVNKERLPIVLKLLSSFGGEGVMFMESREAAKSAIETMRTLKQEILLEECIENPGEDIRGIVAGDEVIASYKRVAAPEEKKANIHAGGHAALFKLNSEMEEITFKSAEAVKAEICAVDMIEGKDGIFVVEVNINPGLGGIEKATDINIAQRIISYTKSQLKK